MIPESLSSIANHLWQSTLFAGAAWLLTLALRKSPARVRHWIWVTAMLKFLAPFALLIAFGSYVPWRATPAPVGASVSIALDQVSQPFALAASSSSVVVTEAARASVVPAIVWTLWICGFLGVGAKWLIRWRRIAAAVRAGSPVDLSLVDLGLVDLGIPIRAMSSPSFLEPGVFGALRPILLLPEGITETLTPEQLRAVIAHELCHVRRRDNLIGVIQMFVETVLWFHPLVWWVGNRIFEERERACDEEVLRLGNEARVYARGILKVCELYLESPMPCVAGVSGSNLRMRIEAILNGRIVKNLNGGTKVLLAVAAMFALASPIVIGLLDGVTVRAQTVSPTLTFEVASVKLASSRGLRRSGTPGPGNTDPGRFSAQLDLMSLVLLAHDLPLYRMTAADDIFDQQRQFVIEAKMPVDTTREQFNVMLRNLLADRLGLKVHWISKDIDMYAMVVAKGGSKLKPATPDPPPGSNDDSKKGGPLPNRVGDDGFPIPPPGNADWMGGAPGGKMALRGHNQTAEEMAHYIGMRTLDGPVADTTGLAGLTGKYDYTIFWSNPATTAALGINPAIEPDGPSIFEAVQEQLGLKIEKRKLPAQVLVVDHVQKTPTEN